MKYRIIIEPVAAKAIGEAYDWIAERAPNAASRWFSGLERAIHSLAEMPQRSPVAPENDQFEEEIRQLLYGRRAHRYRVLWIRTCAR